MRILKLLAFFLSFLAAANSLRHLEYFSSILDFAFAFWMVFPFLLFCGAIYLAPRKTLVVILLVVILVAGVFGHYAYQQSKIDPSSTASLVFVFIPLYQSLAAGILALLGFLFRRGKHAPASVAVENRNG